MNITYGEAEKFYADLLDSKTPRSAKYLVYQTYAEAKERNDLINKVLEAWRGTPTSVTLRTDVLIITDNLFIIEEDYPKNVDYSIVTKDEDGKFTTYPIHCDSLNQALLAAHLILTYPSMSSAQRVEGINFIQKFLYYFNKEDVKNV